MEFRIADTFTDSLARLTGQEQKAEPPEDDIDDGRHRPARFMVAGGCRVRADSERELAAATQRRDSINAQLANVRQMLATLTGAPAVADPFEKVDVPEHKESAQQESAQQESAQEESAQSAQPDQDLVDAAQE